MKNSYFKKVRYAVPFMCATIILFILILYIIISSISYKEKTAPSEELYSYETYIVTVVNKVDVEGYSESECLIVNDNYYNMNVLVDRNIYKKGDILKVLIYDENIISIGTHVIYLPKEIIMIK